VKAVAILVLMLSAFMLGFAYWRGQQVPSIAITPAQARPCEPVRPNPCAVMACIPQRKDYIA
jgi:hypothetical protein